MINFNPPGTHQFMAGRTGITKTDAAFEARLSEKQAKCGICGGREVDNVGKIAGVPEKHCAKCRTWLRDQLRLIFFR